VWLPARFGLIMEASMWSEEELDLSALQITLRQFAAERDWQPFHTPKNLAMALMVETAELAEIFQWMTPEQSQCAHQDQVTKERIGDEVADVLLYLLQLADHAEIDLKRTVGRKLVMNAKKYPPLRPGLPSGSLGAASPPQTHVLVDWENVQPKDVDIRRLVPDVTDVWVFHGPHQKKVNAHHVSFGDRATLIPIARTGKNALDFHLSFYMGYIASRQPGARFVVMANDRGYGPLVEHATNLGFSARQVGFTVTPAATVVPPSSSAARAVPPVMALDLMQAVARIEASLRKTTGRPAKESTLVAAIASMLGSAANDESVSAVLSGLLAGGNLAIDEAGHVAYSFP
jgi:NTP pyrophosphatase (non-canonical NTP hydrolase)